MAFDVPRQSSPSSNPLGVVSRVEEALAFDDVLVVPAYSQVLPSSTSTVTRLTRGITLNIPLISAAMDTVTEAEMAIAMAQLGGMGVIHKNMTPEEQAAQVRRVKKYESGMVVNPLTIHPDQTLADVKLLMTTQRISGIPVVERQTNRLVGIVTNRDVRFATEPESHPLANKDELGRLRVAAATGVGPDGEARARALIAAETDIIVVDTAHGHSEGVLRAVEAIKKASNTVQVIAGNVATPEGAQALIAAGVDAVKIGIGPGSICTTRIVAGVGVPQFTAVMETSAACKEHGVPSIADGGMRTSGDVVKAIAAGADCCMIGSLLAGTDEAPGEVFLYQGRSYKSYRGMGSLGAMARGSADRYFQQDIKDQLKLVPEGVEGRVGYKGPVGNVVHQLVGGLKAGMGYTGSADIASLQANTRFRRVTGAGLRESHVHDVAIDREAPNYRQD
jgi:IMP dehydrogenase